MADLILCSIDGCELPAQRRGMCRSHYDRLRRTGDPLRRPPLAVDARFWPKVHITETCWLWTAGVNANGYGKFAVSKQHIVYAHRWAYEQFVGAIPDGLEVDHLCRVRRCVNPDHLEAVSRRTNVLRSSSFTALQARQTHCIRGHEFTPENTRLYRGQRKCLACQRLRR